MKLIAALAFLSLPAFAAEDPFAAVPANVLAYHQQLNGKRCEYGQQYADDSIGAVASAHDLGQGWTLYLVPCSMGAYQTNFQAYATNAKNPEVNHLDFIHWMGDNGPYAQDSLTNATFENGQIRSHTVYRSIGDCGEDAFYQPKVVDGWQLLVKTTVIRAKEKCDGKMNPWPVVFGK